MKSNLEAKKYVCEKTSGNKMLKRKGNTKHELERQDKNSWRISCTKDT